VKFNRTPSPLLNLHLDNEQAASRVPRKLPELSFPEYPKTTSFVSAFY
jgi:hypothetical protein